MSATGKQVLRIDRRHAPRRGRRLAVLLAVAAGLLAAAAPAHAETVTGTFRYADTNPDNGAVTLRPIAFSRVEIWRFRPRTLGIWTWGHDATAFTNGSGSISMSVPFAANGTLVAVRVFATNYAAEVWPNDAVHTLPFHTEPLAADGSNLQRRVTSSGDVVDFSFDFADSWTPQHFNLAETVRHGFDYAAARRGDSDPLPQADVQPTSVTNSWYNPVVDTVVITSGDVFSDFLILHEYGHFLEEQISSFPWIASVHDGCVARDGVTGAVINSAGHAWMEAFASYFAASVGRFVPTGTLAGNGILGGTFPPATLESPGTCPTLPPGFTGDTVELFVGGVLWDLFDQSGDPGTVPEACDTLSRRDREIFQIFDSELDVQGVAPTITAFRAAWMGRGLPGAALACAFAQNGVPLLQAFPPVANAGPDQTHNEGTLVTLDGSRSEDPDRSPLSFSWTQVGGPAVALSNPASANPSFTAPTSPGGAALVFRLVVNDGSANSAPDQVTINVLDVPDPEADLAVGLSDSPDPVGVGDALAYTVSVTNLGPDAASAVTLQQTLPAGAAFASRTASQGSCAGSGPVQCSLGFLAAGASATVNVVVNPTAAGTALSTASAAPGGTVIDPNPANNSRTASTAVLGTSCTVVGTNGPDVLFGSAGHDIVCGLAGDDQLFGAEGSDELRGGEGADDLRGGSAGDALYGGPGDDRLEGGADNDAELGGAGNDMIDQGPAPDGGDSVSGGDGWDVISYAGRAGGVPVSLDGLANDGDMTGTGARDDASVDVESVIGGAGDDTLVGNDDANRLEGGPGNDSLDGRRGNDSLDGGSGNDRLDDGEGDDELLGSLGNDHLVAWPGADYLRGGGGRDLADYRDRAGGVSVSLDDFPNDGDFAGEGDDVGSDVEDVMGGWGPDVIVGSAAANTLWGSAAHDELHGLAGNDLLVGGADGDLEFGGDGNDRFRQLEAAEGPDDLNGGLGVDVADYGERMFDVLVTLDGLADDGDTRGEGDNVRPDVENAIGGRGRDLLVGSAVRNDLTGGLGADRLQGGGGNDVLAGGGGGDVESGGSGNDVFRQEGAANGGDVLAGGANVDTVTYAARALGVAVSLDGAANDGAPLELDNVRADVENVTGGAGNDDLVGSALANHLVGNGGKDQLTGGPGADNLGGGAGDDTLWLRDGVKDTASGGSGFDRAQVDAALDITTLVEVFLP